MANTNVFGGFYNFPALSGALTSETVFPYPIAQGVGTGSPAFPAGSSAVLAVRPDIALGLIDGHPFRVRAYGKATGGASAGALTINMYWVGSTVTNPATVPVSGNKLATLATSSLSGASGNFQMEAVFIWDSVSQAMQGSYYKAGTGVTATAAVALANVVSPTSVTALQFLMTATFAGGTANSVTLTEFSLEQD